MTLLLSQVAISKFVSESPRFHFSLTLTPKISGASTSSLLSGTLYKLVLRIHYGFGLIKRDLLNGQVIFVFKIIRSGYGRVDRTTICRLGFDSPELGSIPNVLSGRWCSTTRPRHHRQNSELTNLINFKNCPFRLF